MSSSRADDALAELIAEVTDGELIAIEPMQTLWSGYGQLVRCQLVGAQAKSVIVKHVRWPTSHNHPRGWATDRSHQRKVRSYEVETHWYQTHAMRCGQASRVPRCLATRRQDDEVFIVLEDLGGAGYSERRTSVSDDELGACLRWLANFHATFMGAQPDGLWTVGTYWHLATRPDELDALEDGPLKRRAADIDRMLSGAEFLTVVHGDAKLANFCFSADGREVAAVDFQYVGGGCGMKDVAYFISSCLDERTAEKREAELLDLYFAALAEALAATGSELDTAAIEAEWRKLYPVAWTDFVRFLRGWSPGHWKLHSYSNRLAREVLGEA